MDESGVSGQSAIEYLMTYGWMLLVVAITGSVVFATVQSSSPDSISGFSGGEILIDDFGVTSDDELGLEIRGESGQGIVVSEINVSDPGTGEWVYKEFTGDTRVYIGDSRIFKLPNVSRSDSGNNLDIEIVYDSAGLSNMSVFGTIRGELGLTDTGSYQGSLQQHEEVNQESELMLYSRGSQEDNWVEGYIDLGETSKEEEYLRAEADSTTGATARMVTESMHDLSDINSISIEWEGLTDDDSPDDNNAQLIISQDQNEEGDGEIDFTRTSEFSTTAETFDVSGISGERYILFAANGASEITDSYWWETRVYELELIE